MVEFCAQEPLFEHATSPALAASAWTPPQFTIIRPWVINIVLSSNHVATFDVQSENTQENAATNFRETINILNKGK